MARTARKRVKKEKTGRRWTLSLSASILAHAIAIAAVPGISAINERINFPPVGDFIYVDISRQQASPPEAAVPEPAEEPEDTAAQDIPGEPEDEPQPEPAPGPSENAETEASLAARTEAGPRPFEKESLSVTAAAGASQEDAATAPAGPAGGGEKTACNFCDGVPFEPSPGGDFAVTAGPAPGGMAAGNGVSVSGGGASGTDSISRLSGKGRPAAFNRGGGGNEAGIGRDGGGKAVPIGRAIPGLLAGSPLIRTADLKEPEETEAEITITSPPNHSTFDALSCGEITVSGVVEGGTGPVRVCLNGRVYEAAVTGGIFSMKFPPEVEENLLFAEAVNAGGAVRRSDNVYFKVLNVDPGELAVFLDCGGQMDSVRFRCSWRPHPLSGPGVQGGEPRFDTRGTPGGEAVSVMKAAPGIYTVGLDYESPGARDAVVRVYLYSREPVRRKARAIPVRLSGKGYIPAVRVLLPEGVFWEDDSWFSGEFENTRERIKFREPEGIIWKEINF